MEKILHRLLIVGVVCFTIWGIGFSAQQPQNIGIATPSLWSYAPVQFGGGLITTFGVIGSSVIPYTGSNIMVLSSASITMASLPTISTNIIVGLSGVGGTGGVIPDGSFVTLTTTTPFKITLKDNSSLSGSLLDLGGQNSNVSATEVFSSTRPITFMFNSGTGHWVQVSPNNGTF